MKVVVFMILLCVLGLCKSECVKEYSQEGASAARKAGYPWINCEGQICYYDKGTTRCCGPAGECVWYSPASPHQNPIQWPAICILTFHGLRDPESESEKAWDEHFKKIVGRKTEGKEKEDKNKEWMKSLRKTEERLK